MQFTHFKNRFKIDYYSGYWKIWDNEKEKFVGADFNNTEEAMFFYEKLKYFLYDYENNKLN